MHHFTDGGRPVIVRLDIHFNVYRYHILERLFHPPQHSHLMALHINPNVIEALTGILGTVRIQRGGGNCNFADHIPTRAERRETWSHERV